MNIAVKKLAMLEKDFRRQEEEARVQGYTSSPVDSEFRRKVSNLMEKVPFVI